MGGWMDGWMDGWESRVKDCLQQSKIIIRLVIISQQANSKQSWCIFPEKCPTIAVQNIKTLNLIFALQQHLLKLIFLSKHLTYSRAEKG